MKKSLIIVEGLDRCGKTTIIEKFINAIDGCKVIKCNKPTGDVIKHYEELIQEINNSFSDDIHTVLLDRSWIGEYVYGNLYRNESWDLSFISKFQSLLTPDIDVTLWLLWDTNYESLLSRDDGNSSYSDAIDIHSEVGLFWDASDELKAKKKVDLAWDEDANDDDAYFKICLVDGPTLDVDLSSRFSEERLENVLNFLINLYEI